MKLFTRTIWAFALMAGMGAGELVAAESQLVTNWFTTNSAKYARVYKTTTAEGNGTTSTTWTDQDLPVYSDIQVVSQSSTWVYVQYSGLASHVMGPWLNPQGGQFQFWPVNQAGIRRFPKTPVVQSGTKDSTSGGYSGLFVNGVAIFNALDGQAWDGSQIQGQAPHTQSTYYWHRNAPVAEAFNFDAALGHQPPSGIYHTHQNPLGLRYQLGDHVDYSTSTKDYTEGTGTPTKHSPIIGWAHDGYPIYGPYGYGTALSSASAVRRMVPGYAKRDGNNGTDIVNNNRSVIPAWYARYRVAHFGGSYSTTAGASRPAVNTTYPLGTFAQDWDYLGDVGKTYGTDFDLDEYNGRFCVTPEYPSGTYAYFTAIDSTGAATYPYLLAFEFYGDAKGGSVASISESVTHYYVGGPNTPLVLDTPSVNNDTATVTLVWSSVEGGTYQVESSPNQSTWTTQAASVSAQGTSTQSSYTGSQGTGYGRVTRTALATYESATTGTFTTAQTDTESYTISALTITTQPQSQTVNEGDDVTFTVVASGAGPFTYLWYKGSDAIPTATSSTYTLNDVTAANAATYKVVVTGSAGSLPSDNAVLTVITPPTITTEPLSQTISQGNSVTFSVVASGTTPFTYVWRKGSDIIGTATGSSYTINGVTLANEGTYTVTVSNSAGSDTSVGAVLTVSAPVNTAPTITTEPVSQTVNENGNATFSVVATGTATLSYQWKFNDDNIPSANGTSYTVTGATSANQGSYTVVVTNPYGSDTSAVVTLTVLPATSDDSVIITEWLTDFAGRYARIYETKAAETAGTSVTTWNRGAGVQTTPTYGGVQEISYSEDWVYIRTTGLGYHVMGPWYLDAQKTQLFPNYPDNSRTLWRFPRNPAAASSPTLTSLGAIGYFVDGVAMFDGQDGYYWNGTAEAQSGTGGLWNRDAFPVEGVSFDPANAHQEQTGMYHYHANPMALRYLMGDHVDYNTTTKVYSEKAGTPTQHSPIIGWVKDGYPIYGPYGYANATDANSGIRRMTTGYALRNGQNSTVNLSVTGRITLPAWAARGRNRSATLAANEYGPNVTGIYTIGRYHEDYEYLGDVGKVQGTDFDLDEHNGRFCKTPEFPNGTYAYFMTINDSGTPVYPYNIGRVFYGNPTGGSVASISETVVTNWVGAASREIKFSAPTTDVEGGLVLRWSAIEGGTYQIESSTDLMNWSLFDELINEEEPAGAVELGYTVDGSSGTRFYRVKITGVATYDSVTGAAGGGGGGGGGGTVTFNATFATNPPLPPQNAIEAAAVGGVTATITSYTQATGAVTLQFDNSTLANGSYSATLKFTPPSQSQQTLTSSNQYTKN
jgi:hypothetical protein